MNETTGSKARFRDLAIGQEFEIPGGFLVKHLGSVVRLEGRFRRVSQGKFEAIDGRGEWRIPAEQNVIPA